MAANRSRRLAKELAEINADKISKITVAPADKSDDLMHLKGTFPGPSGTAYEGGLYRIDIVIPSEYPFRPPIMRFDTKVWHPNVSSQTVSTDDLVVFVISDVFDRVPSALIPCPPHGHLSSLSSPHYCHYSPYSVHLSPRTLKMPK